MNKVEDWARIERQFLKEEIDGFKAGAKMISPSGEDISVKKLEELKSRREHADKILDELAQSADPMKRIYQEMRKTPQERSSS